MTLLCTGFEPFGEHEANPSATVARRLDGDEVAGHRVVGAVLPVEFDAVDDRLRSLVAEHEPAVILATGLAGGRTCASVERVGVNVDDAVTTPDNADADPADERIDGDGPAAQFASIPVVETVEALLDAGIPARVSNSAGTHLCNHVLYATRTWLEATGRDVPMGFVHLPYTPGQAIDEAEAPARGGGVPASMPVDRQVEAVRVAFETALG